MEGGAAWHAAAYHCLDVAASARALLQSNDLLRRRLAELLEIRETQVIDLITGLGPYAATIQATLTGPPQRRARRNEKPWRGRKLAWLFLICITHRSTFHQTQ